MFRPAGLFFDEPSALGPYQCLGFVCYTRSAVIGHKGGKWLGNPNVDMKVPEARHQALESPQLISFRIPRARGPGVPSLDCSIGKGLTKDETINHSPRPRPKRSEVHSFPSGNHFPSSLASHPMTHEGATAPPNKAVQASSKPTTTRDFDCGRMGR